MDWVIKERANKQTNDQGLLKGIYEARGVSPEEDLSYPLDQLHHFNQLKDIQIATQRLEKALNRQENIIIIGDYDTDGATSTTLMVTVLKAFGFHNVSFAVPDRFKYGYGLTSKLIKDLDTDMIDLLITVDNGIASHEGVNYANEKNIDVIITDHHLSSDSLPSALAIINPNQINDKFPSKHLAGVGVAFYVLLALRDHLKQKGHKNLPNMKQFLDIVALGTVADLVPLDYNNRILVYHGIKLIKDGYTRPGITSLLSVSKKSAHDIVASDFSFQIAPKLNAAGRLDDMTVGINCLLAKDKKTSHGLALELQSLNDNRKNIDQQMQAQAANFVESIPDIKEQSVIVLFHQDWHEGVVGIVASKIKEKYHKPTFIFAQNEQFLKASARSIPGINLKDVLTYLSSLYPNLLKGYGGHAMAAGLSIAKEDLDEFKKAIKLVMKKFMKQAYLQKVFLSDGDLKEGDIHLRHAQDIEAGGPWGMGFEEPVFHGKFKLLETKSLANGRHGAYTLKKYDGTKLFSGIYFNVNPEHYHGIRDVIMVYQMRINRFNHRSSLQLQILAMKAIS